ncbi:MAG: 4Fe-4S dicluster domain-containing protein [Thermodesulfobacteriota bacterium]
MTETSMTGRIEAVETPEEVFVPVAMLDHVVQRGQAVSAGQILARAAAPWLADAHSPIDGVVVDSGRYVVRISSKGQAKIEAPELPGRPEPSGPRERLGRLGKAILAPETTELLVVNAYEPEPGVSVASAMLRDMQATLEAGLKSAVEALSPGRIVLAGPSTLAGSLPGCEPVLAGAAYPATLGPMVVKTLTGKENPAGVAVLSITDLAELGRIAESGRALTDLVVECEGRLYRVPVGAPVGMVLDKAGIAVSSGDRVILGGGLRGEAVKSLAFGIPKGTYAVTVIRKGAYPPVEDSDCVGCGECIRRCPARIDPCMISRYSEFGHHDKAELEYVDACFECGVCGYHCISRRPLLQYIRLSKRKLELARREAV